MAEAEEELEEGVEPIGGCLGEIDWVCLLLSKAAWEEDVGAC